MNKKLLISVAFSMMLVGMPVSVRAQRTENVESLVGMAAGAMGGGAALGAAAPLVEALLSKLGINMITVRDDDRWQINTLINLEAFEKVMAYDQNIQEIFVNTESTAEEGKNATQDALAQMPVSEDFKELVSGETGDGNFTTGGSDGASGSQGASDSAVSQDGDPAKTAVEKKLEEWNKNTKAPQRRLDVKQSSKSAGMVYVANNFFYKKPAQNASQEVEDMEMQRIQNKRKKLVRDIVLDALTYSQLFKNKGASDFENRMQTIQGVQRRVKTETESIATGTLALKNIVQELMLQVVLEQKLLRLEAAKNLNIQDIQMEE